MSTSKYYGPSGQELISSSPLLRRQRVVEAVGPRELELILQARESNVGMLLVSHCRAGNKHRMAARRLVERKLLAGLNAYGGQRTGWLYAYTLTVRGRECWLRTKVQG